MDFQQLISVASNKQKTKEKELATSKVGYSTQFKSPVSNNAKSKVSEEKQKKLAKIMQRVEAQKGKKKIEKKPMKFNDTIMDFTGTGLSENDIRRKKLSDQETQKKRQEFLAKMKHLKENPIRPEDDEEDIPLKCEKPQTAQSSKLDKNSEKRPHSTDKHSKDRAPERHKDRSQINVDQKDKHRHEKSRDKDKKRDKDRDKKSRDPDRKHKQSDKHKHKRLPTVEADIVTVEVRKPPPPPVKKKKPPSGPPPMSFADLLSVANENKQNPNAMLEAAKPQVEQVKEKKKPAPEENRRPMTQDEIDRMQRKKSAAYQKWLQQGGPRPAGCPKPKAQSRPTSRETVDASSSSDEEPAPKPTPRAASKPNTAPPPMAYPKRAPGRIVEGSIDHKPKYQKSKSIFVPHSKEQRDRALARAGYGHSSIMNGDRPGHNTSQTKNKTQAIKNGMQPVKNGTQPVKNGTQPVKNGMQPVKNGTQPVKNGTSIQDSSKTNNVSARKSDLKSASKSKPQETSKPESGPKSKHKSATPAKSTASGSKVAKTSGQTQARTIKQEAENPRRVRSQPEPPTNPWDRIYGQIQKSHPKPERKSMKRGNVIDSESEYDSELEDFIDDDDDDFIDDSGAGDYSKHIQEIFRYDKRKYQHVDEDDMSDMEAGYDEVMKEEARSAKIGLLEDLEDMRQEEEEKKQKMLMKKNKAKKLKIR